MRKRQSGFRAGKWVAAVSFVMLMTVCGCALEPQTMNSASSSQPGTNPAPLPAATISFCDNPDPGCSPASSFSLAALRDLNVRVNLSDLSPRNHMETLNVVHPGGGLYQTFHNSFVIQEKPTGTLTTMNAVPVSGTWIAQRSMTGTWEVQVFLDGRLLGKQSVTLTR
jgi:hypothetical protein